MMRSSCFALIAALAAVSSSGCRGIPAANAGVLQPGAAVAPAIVAGGEPFALVPIPGRPTEVVQFSEQEYVVVPAAPTERGPQLYLARANGMRFAGEAFEPRNKVVTYHGAIYAVRTVRDRRRDDPYFALFEVGRMPQSREPEVFVLAPVKTSGRSANDRVELDRRLFRVEPVTSARLGAAVFYLVPTVNELGAAPAPQQPVVRYLGSLYRVQAVKDRAWNGPSYGLIPMQIEPGVPPNGAGTPVVPAPVGPPPATLPLALPPSLPQTMPAPAPATPPPESKPTNRLPPLLGPPVAPALPPAADTPSNEPGLLPFAHPERTASLKTPVN